MLLNKKGFTLIEMLVVIAIISILIGIGINTFTIAQKKARDVRRKADLRSYQTALELYKQDTGLYPASPTGWVYAHGLVLAPYLNQNPKDPKDDQNGCFDYAAGGNGGAIACWEYSYYDCGTRQQYFLGAHLENTGDPQAGVAAGSGACTPQYPQWYFVGGGQ